MKKVYYDLKSLPERMEDLRLRDGKNKLTYDDLVSLIEKNTGEHISKTTLSNYENSDDIGNMRIGNLIAIANTYNVSLDYLMGKTKSKMHDYIAQDVANKFSLSDKSMRNLSNFTTNSKKKDCNQEFKIKLINFIIENEMFLNDLAEKLASYYNANDNKLCIKDEMKEKYGISTLELTRSLAIKVFEEFLDNSYEQLWKNMELKPQYLFDMPKKQKGGNK